MRVLQCKDCVEQLSVTVSTTFLLVDSRLKLTAFHRLAAGRRLTVQTH